MAERGEHIIVQLRRGWTNRMLWSCVLLAAAFLVVSVAIFLMIFDGKAIWIPVFAGISGILSYLLFYSPITATDVASYLDKFLPAAEDSASLWLKPEQELNFFEQRQISKLEKQFPAEVEMPAILRRKWKAALSAFGAAVLVATMIFFIPRNVQGVGEGMVKESTKSREVRLPGISEVAINIKPPAYTGRPARRQNGFQIQAEEGGEVWWTLKTSLPADSMMLMFNDRTVLRMRPSEDRMTWSAMMPIRKSGFYQVKLEEAISGFYSIEMIPDELPEISIHAPASNSTIEPGMAYRTMVDVSVNDDYGVSAASIFATVASGSGEAVAFREQRIPFGGFEPGKRRYQLKKLIDLAQLKMVAGDELYFYISATDNRNHEKRSDVFIVRIEDTAQLMSMEGLSTGIDLKPEFFRSQRQIIIETEQLLKDQGNITRDAFNNKSNDLGTDQKLLRLRYGKFLGEETDAEIGGEHEEEGHEEGHEAGGDILDRYTHKHDNAEDATFFDAETKKQLKATLAEMWKAELQLRTLKPRDALPFEYRALRLLKDLQQSTRAFVAKTGIKTVPLDPAKRLTGDLAGVQQPMMIRKAAAGEEKKFMVQRALGVLEQLRSGERIAGPAVLMLKDASELVSEKAAVDPSTYLPVLTSIGRILNDSYNKSDLEVTGSGLIQIINKGESVPVKSKAGPASKLSDQYFKKISAIND
jgi:hypothetical protein